MNISAFFVVQMERHKRSKKELRAALRRVLLWSGTTLSTSHGKLTTQFVKHLDMGLEDCSTYEKINPGELTIFNERYDEYLYDYEIAKIYRRKVTTIQNILYQMC